MIYMTSEVRVNRACAMREALNASGLFQYKYIKKGDTFPSMPVHTSEVVMLHYFKPDPTCYRRCYSSLVISWEEVMRQYELHELVPDPQAQIVDNIKNQRFAKDNPNACSWTYEGGNFCDLGFEHWLGEDRVIVDNCKPSYWDSRWCFGGVRVGSVESLGT